MSAQIAKLTERVAELEKQLKAFQACVPLSAITAGLTAASAEEVGGWNGAAAAVAEKYPELAAVAAKDKKPSNRPGPVEFNKQVWEVLKTMAEDAGVIYDSFHEGVDAEDEEAVKKADEAFKKAAKDAGVNRKAAMAEASRLKDENEGLTPEQIAAKEAKKEASRQRRAAKVAAKKEAKSSSSSSASSVASAKVKAKKAAAKPEPVDELAALLAELKLEAKTIDGVSYFINKENGEALSDDDGMPGEHVGLYDWKANTLDLSA